MAFIDRGHIQGDINVFGIDNRCLIFTMFSHVSEMNGLVPIVH